MNKKAFWLAGISASLLISLLSSTAFVQPAASFNILRVPLGFGTIQSAINAADSGDTILVASGTYYENLVINKTLALVGENRDTTIIHGNMVGTVVDITASYVNISGFTIKGSGETSPTCSGVFLGFGTYGSRVYNNIIIENYYGIFLESSNENVISTNNISLNTGRGIFLESSSWNTISANFISQNSQDNGIELFDSTNNILTSNTISESGWAGVYLEESGGNTVTENSVASNSWCGIYLYASSFNVMYRNNFIDNGLNEMGQVNSTGLSLSNVWDNGAEGNYWSDYSGEDLNGDGIGDTSIPHFEIDSYPLIEPWSFLRAFHIDVHIVTVFSNSTIASFNYSQSLSQLSFNVTGAPKTLGFSNVTIPKSLLNASYPKMWVLTLDGVNLSFTPIENATHTSILFTYGQSTHRVQIKVAEIQNIPPKADFSYSPMEITPYDTVSFTDTSFDSDGHLIAWYWDFGDGSISIEQNPGHQYAGAGTYVVTLKVTDNQTSQTITSKAVFVRKVKTALRVDTPSVVIQGELFTIAATLKDENQNAVADATIGVYLLREKWEAIGLEQTNGSGVVSIIHVQLLVPGKHYFKTVFNGTQIFAESSSAFVVVTLADNEPPIANAGQNKTVNLGETVTFDGSASTDNVGIVSYEWNFGDGAFDTGKITSHIYTNHGTYTVILTVRDVAGNSASDSIAVTVLFSEVFPVWAIGLILLAIVGVGLAIFILLKRRR